MAGTVTVGAKYKHDNINRLAIRAAEFHRLFERGNKRAGRRGAGDCRMRQCDSIADGRAAKLLAVNDGVEDSPLAQTGVKGRASAQAFKKLFCLKLLNLK